MAAAVVLVLPVLWFPGVVAAAEGPTDGIVTGKDLAFDRKKGNCLACHEISGGTQMGNGGPALKDMKTRFPDPEFLYERIYDEQKFNPITPMPTYGKNRALSKEEIKQIVTFLLSL